MVINQVALTEATYTYAPRLELSPCPPTCRTLSSFINPRRKALAHHLPPYAPRRVDRHTDQPHTGGRLNRATGRASSDRTGLAVAGGTRESDQFLFAGGDYRIGKQLTAQYYVANLEDYYTQHFVGLTHTLPLSEGQSLRTDLRYFRTFADGANDSAAGRASGYCVGGYTEDGDGKIDNHT